MEYDLTVGKKLWLSIFCRLCKMPPFFLFQWVKVKSCSVVSDSLWPHGLYSPWNSSNQNTGVGSLFLLQIFPTQGLNPALPHGRQTLYQLSHQGSPYSLALFQYPVVYLFVFMFIKWSHAVCKIKPLFNFIRHYLEYVFHKVHWSWKRHRVVF